MDQLNIMVGVCYHSRIEPETESSIKAMVKKLPMFNWDSTIVKGASIHRLRNQIIKTSIKKGFDLLLMTDADIAFKPDVLLNLMDHDLPVVFGAYKLKGTDLFDCGMYPDGFPGAVVTRTPNTATGLKKMDWTAGGFCLMKLKEMEKLENPWYSCPVVDMPDGKKDSPGEDVGFCLKLRENKIPVMVDFDLKLEHVLRPDERPEVLTFHLPRELLPGVLNGMKKLPFDVIEQPLREMVSQIKGGAV